jgi:methyl-accepting chemotaxis protein
MSNLKVGARLALAFALLLALMLAAVGFALMGMREAQSQLDRLEHETVALIDAAHAMRIAQVEEGVAIRDFVSLPDVESQRRALQALKVSRAGYAEAAAALEKIATAMHNADIAARVAALKRSGEEVGSRMRDAVALSEAAEYPQAQAVVYNDVRPLQASIAAGLRGLVIRSTTLAHDQAEAARQQAARSEVRLAAAVLAALLIGVVATFLITRGIARPLQSAVDAAERVAEGDLRVLHVRKRRDEAGRVLAALGGMQARLNLLVRAIRDGADAVSHASDQIAEGNTDLAARTEEQAASIEETAASMEELTATVQQNSAHASHASELAARAAQLAVGGGEAVHGGVRGMQDIQKSSRKVSEIVGLMDEMAFQTNLLALNAAVEAARAGEQGRGFGVIAAQVRALAQRSAEAAKEIRGLVAEAVRQSDHGARAATQAGETIAKVVDVAQEVAQVVTEIARASEEQRMGIEQVSGTIAQLDGVTQSNNALVQDINGLTEGLLAQARELVAATSRFTLDGEAAAGATRAPRESYTEPATLEWQPSVAPG